MGPSAWTHTGYAQQLVFGAGSLPRLPELLENVGVRRVLLVSTAGRLASEDGVRLVKILGRRLTSTFAEVTSHVPTPLVQRALLQARRDGIDGIVSFGGGSCADLGKAVAFFTEQEAGTPGGSYADRPVVPHIAIPTTYSGAELTPFFGMTDPNTRQKSGAGGPTSAPMAVIYDPELTLGTPASVSASTGLNALAHCVEVAYSPQRTPEAEAIALAGAGHVFEALPLVVAQPDDLDRRAAMFAASVLSGRCLQNGSMGVHHGLVQLVGGRTGLAHGVANAVILPHAIRFNADAVPEAMGQLGASIGGRSGASPDVAVAVADLVASLGLPSHLEACGMTEADLDRDAVSRLSQSNGNVKANPKLVTEDDARAILEAAW